MSAIVARPNAIFVSSESSQATRRQCYHPRGVRFRQVRAIPAAVLVVIAAWEILRTERAPAGVPGGDAWKRAADVVRVQHQPGDLIVFAPDWIDPVGRRWLGDLIPI